MSVSRVESSRSVSLPVHLFSLKLDEDRKLEMELESTEPVIAEDNVDFKHVTARLKEGKTIVIAPENAESSKKKAANREELEKPWYIAHL